MIIHEIVICVAIKESKSDVGQIRFLVLLDFGNKAIKTAVCRGPIKIKFCLFQRAALENS